MNFAHTSFHAICGDAQERHLTLVHNADDLETERERLTAEVHEASQRVHRALERKLQAASDYEAAVLSRDRKSNALDLVIRVLGRRP